MKSQKDNWKKNKKDLKLNGKEEEKKSQKDNIRKDKKNGKLKIEYAWKLLEGKRKLLKGKWKHVVRKMLKSLKA